MIERLSTFVLSSPYVAVRVVPELGGRMTELIDLKRRRQWLWSNPHIVIGKATPDAAYDDVWQGGFEELFPNDDPAVGIDGIAYPDHGELWATPWQVTSESPEHIELTVSGPVTGARISKRISVDGAQVMIDYSIEHRGTEPFPHLFKLHPAVAVNAFCVIELPGGRVEQVDPEFGNMLGLKAQAEWSEVKAVLGPCRPASSGSREFVYVSNLPEGWCGVADMRAGARMRIQYPSIVFPYCWLFITYGGWRGHNVVVLEPCTNHPKDLDAAITSGTSAILEPGETREFAVVVAVTGI